MTLNNFLKLHQGGCVQNCVSVHQMPYVREKNGYSKTYFEETNQEDIVNSEVFEQIKSKQVEHFNVIGGGMYKVELCIYLKEEKNL